MRCPYCSAENIRVVDTRKFDTCVIRIRVCDSCHAPFQTVEEISLHSSVTISVPPFNFQNTK